MNKYLVSQSHTATKEELEELAKDEDGTIRCNVAENEDTPKEILNFLSKDKEGIVRSYVASNYNAPAEILETLSKDDSYFVRLAVAQNYNVPAKALQIFFNNGEFRDYIARHPNTPLDILIKLNDSEFSHYAKENRIKRMKLLK